MSCIDIRNVKIGEGIPKICVPIVGETREDILKSAKRVETSGADLAEWRVDWYESVFCVSKVESIAGELREILKDIPLLFTFRTAREGGKKAIDLKHYVELNERIIKTKAVDLIDIELFAGDSVVKKMIESAHKENVKVVVSNHDFEKTPEKDEIVRRLRKMQELGADIPKIAVMPQSRKDVLTLLSATEEMVSEYADRPIITMSMSATGLISRLCGECFGSALTFGAVGKASAPGQMNASDLSEILNLIHTSL